MQKTLFVRNLSQIDLIAKYVSDNIHFPSIVLLYGDLGAGKTTFVKALAKSFGVKTTVTSPTFLLHKTYKIKNNLTLEHYDLYRLHNFDELVEIGFGEILQKKNLIAVEWPDKIKNFLAKTKKNSPARQIFKLYFSHTKNIGARKIKIIS